MRLKSFLAGAAVGLVIAVATSRSHAEATDAMTEQEVAAATNGIH
jgi:hypothetical protein